MVEIIACGQLTLDMVLDIAHLSTAQLIEAGKLFEMGAMQISTGGSVSNTGLALQRLGADVRLMALVGADLPGQFTLDYIQKRDAKLTDFITIHPTARSSQTIILAPENRDRTFLHYSGTNGIFGYEWINFDVLRQAKILHFGYPPYLPRMYADDGAELVKIFAKARAVGVITSLDTSVPEAEGRSGQANWAHILAQTLPYVDIFVPSIEEIIFMLRHADYERWQGQVMAHITGDYLDTLADDLLAYGVAIVGFKLGEAGMYIRGSENGENFTRLKAHLSLHDDWQGARVYHAAYVVDVAGTTGAGDAAYAGFLAALLQDLSPVACIQIACAVGACNCEVLDATTGIQTWEATRQRIAAGWETHSSALLI